MSLEFNDVYKTEQIIGAIATVGNISIADDHTTMTFSVNYHKQTSDASDAYNIEYYSCEFDLSKGDVVTQAYSYLKTISKFSISTEV